MCVGDACLCYKVTSNEIIVTYDKLLLHVCVTHAHEWSNCSYQRPLQRLLSDKESILDKVAQKH